MLRALSLVYGTVAIFTICAGGYGFEIKYTVTDLGILDGPTSISYDINNLDWVCGSADVNPSFAYAHAFAWTGSGPLQNLGSFGGLQSVSVSHAINESGSVVGDSDNSSGNTRAFLWTGGTIQDIGTLGGQQAEAYDINNAGAIVGQSQVTSGTWHGYTYSNGTMTDLGAAIIPTAINNSGQFAGNLPASDGNFYNEHAFLSSGGTVKNLGTLGGTGSFVERMNDSGEVVGFSYTVMTISPTARQPHAFLYTDHMQDLGTLGGPESYAYGINNSGTVVGGAFINSTNSHGFIYTATTGMVDLNNLVDPSLGWDIVAAEGINDSGYIAATGISSAGGQRALLLRPVDVPEPETSAILITAAIPFLFFAFFRRRANDSNHVRYWFLPTKFYGRLNNALHGCNLLGANVGLLELPRSRRSTKCPRDPYRVVEKPSGRRIGVRPRLSTLILDNK
jgi:probable HAF family extracellular repeat protein